MGGNWKFRSSFQRSKRCIGGDDGDRISQLPDEILVDILSYLPAIEAARTSVVSSRWTNLWKHTTRLNLECDGGLSDDVEKQNLVWEKYVRWVNRVLESHKGPTLTEFRIRFCLSSRDCRSIIQWLQFASAKQIQKFEMDFQRFNDFYVCPIFVDELVARNFCFKFFRALMFRYVNVTGEAIELFLHNCPLLEKLIVHHSKMSSSLRVCGGSSSSQLVLKHLEIVHCFGLNSLEVSTPSLTCFRASTYYGLSLENVRMLVEMHANCRDDDVSLGNAFSALSCCRQLENLRLVLQNSGIMSELRNLLNCLN